MRRREVCKAGLVQQKETPAPSKMPISFRTKKNVGYLPEKWYVLCVHDDDKPFLELYGCEKDISSHLPQKVVDLFNCSYVTRVVEDERTFVIGFDDNLRNPLELTALTKEECDEWIAMLTYKLTTINCLPSDDNNYVPMPFQLSANHSNQLATTDNVDEEDFARNVIYDALNFSSNHSNHSSNDTPQQLYEHIRHSFVGDSAETPEEENAPTFHPITSNGECPSIPPLPPRRTTPSSSLSINVGNISLNSTVPTENHYSTAPIYNQLSSARHSTESHYDHPSPPLPSGSQLENLLKVQSEISSESVANQNSETGASRCGQNKQPNMYENFVSVPDDNYGTLGDVGRYSKVRMCRRVTDDDLQRMSLKSKRNQSVNLESNEEQPASTIRAFSVDDIQVLSEDYHDSAATTSTINADKDESNEYYGCVEVPLAPLIPPPAVPPLPARNSSNEVKREGSASTITSLKETEVRKLNSEIQASRPVKIKVSMEAIIRGLALVELGGGIWIAGWTVKYNKVLSAGFHVGDQIISVDNRSVPTSLNEMKHLLNILAFAGPVEICVKRLPFGKCFLLERLVEGKKLGFVRKKGKNEVIDVESGSIASITGISSKTSSFLNPNVLVNWFITEVNGRPLSLISRNNEAGERLAAVGLEISVVLQPVDFVKSLKKCLKQQQKNYKEYLIG